MDFLLGWIFTVVFIRLIVDCKWCKRGIEGEREREKQAEIKREKEGERHLYRITGWERNTDICIYTERIIYYIYSYTYRENCIYIQREKVLVIQESPNLSSLYSESKTVSSCIISRVSCKFYECADLIIAYVKICFRVSDESSPEVTSPQHPIRRFTARPSLYRPSSEYLHYKQKADRLYFLERLRKLCQRPDKYSLS